MAALLPLTLPGPSPSRANPFALARRTSLEPSRDDTSFSRTSLLPTIPSPARPQPVATTHAPTPTWTPANKADASRCSASDTGSGSASANRQRSSWRLLWRGGLEIGPEGYRLDGVTFFALLTFPSTPSQPISNPFDAPLSSTPGAPNPVLSTHSPFALPSGDTDLCLSLESMRGRKYLQVQGVTDLAEDDVLDGSDTDGGVQMAIAPSSVLLVSYFTGLLCRDSSLGKGGRTKKAIMLRLGDEVASSGDDNPSNTLLIYGQLHSTTATTIKGSVEDTPPSQVLRLHVARRKPPPPPPSAIKVRPGEPLPRAPLFFPAKAPRRPPPPFPHRSALSKSRSFSRTSSVTSIYAPPPRIVDHRPSAQGLSGALPPAPVSGRTPGRRGEKRRKIEGNGETESGESEEPDDERRRKAGRIMPVIKTEPDEPTDHKSLAEASKSASSGGARREEEDIFGKRPHSMVAFDPSLPSAPSSDAIRPAQGDDPPLTAKKRPRLPQQALDNKAMIRKQTLVIMESRGIPRDHEIFKDVFAITTKGVNFVFRDAIADAPLDKMVIASFVHRHLDMYLPPPHPASGQIRGKAEMSSGSSTAVEDDIDTDDKLVSIKEEVEAEAGVREAALNEVKVEVGPDVGIPQTDGLLLKDEKASGGVGVNEGNVLTSGCGSPGGYISRSRSMDVVKEEEEEEEVEGEGEDNRADGADGADGADEGEE